ncbi:MAG: RNA polymerase sigma factor [Candidatus Coproplasma sp.]
MKNSSLEEKIERYKKGDKSAFDYIYEHTYKPLYFNILYYVKDKACAEDLMHDAYLKALNNLSSYQIGTNFIGWLCKIGKNLALNYIEKHKREILTDFSEPFFGGSYEQELPYIFEVAQKNLTEEEYQIVMLCQVAGYKRREVAEIFSQPIATITWKNNQALKKLKEILEDEQS